MTWNMLLTDNILVSSHLATFFLDLGHEAELFSPPLFHNAISTIHTLYNCSSSVCQGIAWRITPTTHWRIREETKEIFSLLQTKQGNLAKTLRIPRNGYLQWITQRGARYCSLVLVGAGYMDIEELYAISRSYSDFETNAWPASKGRFH